MKPRHFLPLITGIILLAGSVAFAQGNNYVGADQALRKVIAAGEVAELNMIPQTRTIIGALVQEAINLLPSRGRFGRNYPGDRESLGVYIHPDWFDNREGDADFRVPFGMRFTQFSFDMTRGVDIHYVILFDRNGRILIQEYIRNGFNNSFVYQVPLYIRPELISTIRLHVRAPRGAVIQAFGDTRGGGGGPFPPERPRMLLIQVQNLLNTSFPNMFEIRRLLGEVEQLLDR